MSSESILFSSVTMAFLVSLSYIEIPPPRKHSYE